MSYGIRVKNPLTKHVRVEVIEGKTIICETVVAPGSNKFIGLDEAGQYDIRTTILDRLDTFSLAGPGVVDDELGPAAFNVVDHQDVKEPEMKPVVLSQTTELNFKFWRDIVTWKVTIGCSGELMAVEIEPSAGAVWRIKVMKPGDGRAGGKLIKLERTTTFSGLMFTGGHIIKLQAKSANGNKVSVSGRISGRETVVDEGLSPTAEELAPTADAAVQAEEEKEVTVRSMGDIFKELEEQEVKV